MAEIKRRWMIGGILGLATIMLAMATLAFVGPFSGQASQVTLIANPQCQGEGDVHAFGRDWKTLESIPAAWEKAPVSGTLTVTAIKNVASKQRQHVGEFSDGTTGIDVAEILPGNTSCSFSAAPVTAAQ